MLSFLFFFFETSSHHVIQIDLKLVICHGQCRSLDLTGGNWGLRKRHKDRHREKLGSGGPDTPDERCWWPLLPTSAFIYIACMGKQGETQVEFSWVQQHRRRNRTSVVCCYLVQTILTRSVCSVFLSRQPCWTLPPLGWVHAYQPRGPWHICSYVKAYFHCFSFPQWSFCFRLLSVEIIGVNHHSACVEALRYVRQFC
jgi:hypothetical protein